MHGAADGETELSALRGAGDVESAECLSERATLRDSANGAGTPDAAQALLARKALQQFTQADLEDLNLESAERRFSSDQFTEEGVARQFLLDAAYSEFELDGKELNFMAELRADADASKAVDDAEQAAQRLKNFEARLVAALLGCAGAARDDACAEGDVGRRLALQALSRCMSQSGVANLERACTGPQVVVSGGQQRLRHECRQLAEKTWEVRTTLRKSGFAEVVLIDAAAADGGGPSGAIKQPSVLPVAPSSEVQRGCVMLFRLEDSAAEKKPRVYAEVCDVLDHVALIGRGGGPLSTRLAGSGSDGDSEGYSSMAGAQYPYTSWTVLRSYVLRCWGNLALGASYLRCRRRALRLAAECLPPQLFGDAGSLRGQRIERMRSDTSDPLVEDFTTAGRAPLRRGSSDSMLAGEEESMELKAGGGGEV
eukprot:TRINITY_DN17579_c0_g1_i2.p1 TRINITY_DN17579_c0_g1~~TRINITY_DN17579_c0_g1_i2.p1  ORF type:complete len:426 (-),score=132.41 TRINITY_DN17579_c0_g1_i2:766-2043(-)